MPWLGLPKVIFLLKPPLESIYIYSPLIFKLLSVVLVPPYLLTGTWPIKLGLFLKLEFSRTGYTDVVC